MEKKKLNFLFAFPPLKGTMKEPILQVVCLLAQSVLNLRCSHVASGTCPAVDIPIFMYILTASFMCWKCYYGVD